MGVLDRFEKRGEKQMNSQLKDYINGKTNVVKDEFIISRERSRNNDLIFVNIPGVETPMYALWNSKKDAKANSVKITDAGYVIEKVKKKGTGGKHAYVMLVLNELEGAKKISIEASGLLLKLLPYIEWNTLRLVRNRDKASLTQQMIADDFGIGTNKTKKLMSELCKGGVVEYRNKAYFVKDTLIRKGRSKCD